MTPAWTCGEISTLASAVVHYGSGTAHDPHACDRIEAARNRAIRTRAEDESAKADFVSL